MKVLVVGSGGREHALVWKLKQSPRVKKIYCAPGNGGIARMAECVSIQADDTAGLINFAKQEAVDLTVVGPELPLVKGIVDAFEKENLRIFGPNQAAAQLEASKAFAKEFMQQCNIPTAMFHIFNERERAEDFLFTAEYPVVIKADGLASGKGVVICPDFKEAQRTINDMMEKKIFKEAGAKVVIEQCLEGEEVSILTVSDGEHYIILESSQDHKRVFDDDLGPNTGGMGAYSPAKFISSNLLKKIEARIIEPALRGMKRLGSPFKGILYAGLMMTKDGPYVLEFNVRFGDPETQAILPRLKADLFEVMLASGEGRLDQVRLEWDPRSCVCVVMCSGGYPGKYETGKDIIGLELVDGPSDTFVFHGGTETKNGRLVTSGGRVLSVASLGDTVPEAVRQVYAAVDKISFEHMFFRRDIGFKAMKKLTLR